MASARSRAFTASSSDFETRGTILQVNNNRREKRIPRESMRLRTSMTAIFEPIGTTTGRKSMIEGLC
jgi:hypothetical protein